MTELSLQDHERDVEHARAKLAGDLAVLRLPETLSAFTNDLQHKAKSAAQSTVSGLLEDLKAKAAANPFAALAIGAGLAWRLIHNPPIASALVGVGLFSLWRTNAPRPPSGVQPDYLKQGKQRLKEQSGELLSKATEVAGDVQEIVSTKATDLTDAVKDKIAQWASNVGNAMEDVGSRVQADVERVAGAAHRARHDVRDRLQSASSNASSTADDLFHYAASAGKTALDDEETRNKLLLGVAGVAVAAALGIACQKRISQS
jgi:gas vesicle protein